MKKETKLLAVTVCLPVLRDFLEDLGEDKTFRYEAKKHANEVIRSIDRFSTYMMRGVEKETGEQAVNLELWYRDKLKELEVD